jgi:hypothetical protein
MVRLVTGITARSLDQARGPLRDLVDGVVIDFPWRWAQPDGPWLDDTFTDELLSGLDWCQNNLGVSGLPLQVRLRPRLGTHAPDWLRSAAGVMPWLVDVGDDVIASLPEGVPRWWQPNYLDAAAHLWSELADVTAGHPALAEVVMGWGTTLYAEPCLKQMHHQANLHEAVNGGWTEQADDNAFSEGWEAHRAFGPEVACYTAYNPPGRVLKERGVWRYRHGNPERAARLMEAQVDALEGQVVLANNCLSAPVNLSTPAYRSLYSSMLRLARDRSVPLAFQTETLGRHEAGYPTKNVQRTVMLAVQWGAASVEVPIGAQVETEEYPDNLLDPDLAAMASNAMRLRNPQA